MEPGDSTRLKIVIIGNPLCIFKYLGDGSTGKTVLLYAYMKKKYNERYIPTEIYDTAGQEDFGQIRTLVYPNTDVFILCYSCVFRPSLVNVEKFWFVETKKVTAAPYVLVGNKLDLASEQQDDYIENSEAEKVKSRIGAKQSLQCSAQMEAYGSPGNVERVFKTAIKVGLDSQMGIDDTVKKGGCCTLL